MTEEVPSAAESPRFGNQCAASETGSVGAEVIQNFVNEFDGYMDRVSVTLAGREL